ncbi:MAG: hypothetical protein Q8930_13605 [Bacillota bacterium]|nr:hypothetical protein [Bacillota bacterium]
MANIHYTKKRSISMEQFIQEFGTNFSEHMKKRLMELESRSYLVRKEVSNRFDLKHVEHIEYECGQENTVLKEYIYGQFEVDKDILYFSESCEESTKSMQAPIVSTIYDSLNCEGVIFSNGRNLKIVGDNNIDYVVDSTLSACPQVSQRYLDIIHGMAARAVRKKLKA